MTPNLPKIISVVSSVCDVPQAAILSSGIARPIAFARHIVMYIAYEDCGISSVEIARQMHRDHSSVLSAVESLQRRLDRNESAVIGILEKVRACLEVPLPPTSELAHNHSEFPFVMTGATKDDIRKLRDKGMSVSFIAKYLKIPEFEVARVCGVPMWNGKSTTERAL